MRNTADIFTYHLLYLTGTSPGKLRKLVTELLQAEDLEPLARALELASAREAAELTNAVAEAGFRPTLADGNTYLTFGLPITLVTKATHESTVGFALPVPSVPAGALLARALQLPPRNLLYLYDRLLLSHVLAELRPDHVLQLLQGFARMGRWPRIPQPKEYLGPVQLYRRSGNLAFFPMTLFGVVVTRAPEEAREKLYRHREDTIPGPDLLSSQDFQNLHALLARDLHEHGLLSLELAPEILPKEAMDQVGTLPTLTRAMDQGLRFKPLRSRRVIAGRRHDRKEGGSQ